MGDVANDVVDSLRQFFLWRWFYLLKLLVQLLFLDFKQNIIHVSLVIFHYLLRSLNRFRWRRISLLALIYRLFTFNRTFLDSLSLLFHLFLFIDWFLNIWSWFVCSHLQYFSRLRLFLYVLLWLILSSNIDKLANLTSDIIFGNNNFHFWNNSLINHWFCQFFIALLRLREQKLLQLKQVGVFRAVPYIIRLNFWAQVFVLNLLGNSVLFAKIFQKVII